MSLLLDALKKAAEQKSQKSRSESSPERTSDETLLEVAADEATRQAVRGDGSSHLEDDDETDFDHSELGVRLDRIGRQRGTSDDTGLDLPDSTEAPGHSEPEHSQPRSADDETRLELPDATATNFQQDLPARNLGDETGLDIPTTEDIEDSGEDDLSAQMRSGDDETIISLSEEASELAIEPGLVVKQQSANEDETDLSLLDAEEGLSEGRVQSVDSATAEDETDLSEILQDGDHSDDADAVLAVDDTDLGQSPQEETDLSQHRDSEIVDSEIVDSDTVDSDTADDKVAASDSGAADFSPPIQGHEVGEAEKATADSDETDFNRPSAWADQIEKAQAQQHSEDDSEDDSEDEEDSAADHDVVVDEDLSLLLIERETTNPGLAEMAEMAGSAADTSFTDPQTPGAHNLALLDITPGKEELSLADSPQKEAPEDQTDTLTPTITKPTGTSPNADDNRTNLNSPTVARADSTSTRTYAPDNYDRTLMKVRGNDASNVFAGMKPDSDIVMTPDYAKKVFQSKTSVQRARHYWVYAGILGVLVLSIGVYGLFEYQDQTEQIDSSLRLLKRDPLPGIIKTVQPDKTGLFIETDPVANARTVEIIESANQTGSIPVVEDTVSPVESIEEAPASPLEVATAETGPTPSEPEAEPVQAPVAPDDTDQLDSLASPEPSPAQTDAKQNLHITSSSQYQQSDIWLREAYAAYLSGDNRLALSLYNQVLEVDPVNHNALLARAAIQIQDGDIDAAIRDYQALLLANPKDSLAMSSLLAVSAYSPQETESQLKLMIREEPDSPYLNFALANAYGAQKRWQEAQRHYFMALQNNPSDPNYAYNLAVSLEHISQPSSAITYYQRALENFTNGLATFNRDVVNQRLELLGKL